MSVVEMELHPNTESCATIYGPVPSRRHGLSLGINLGDPIHKICTWGCVYCQCGMGQRLVSNSILEAPTASQVLELFRAALAKNTVLDSVTLAGNSEPCSHPEFAQIVRQIVQIKTDQNAKWIFNCLTNGSELDQPGMAEACELLDECWIKLDCGTDDLFRRLNRPVDRIGNVREQVRRILKLKNRMIQTLLWNHADPRLANYSEPSLGALIELFREIQPQRIHLTTVSRIPAVLGIQPVAEQDLERYAERIRQVTNAQVEVYPTRVESF